MPGLKIKFTGDATQLRQTTEKVKADIGGLGKTLSGAAGLLGGAGIAGLLGVMAKRSVELAASQEQLAVSFKTMLGSGEKAKALLSEIQALGSSTPFEYVELANAGKSLLAFGVDSKDVVETLRRLGDVASGLNIPLGELAEIYGKAKVQGRLFTEDINQLTGRGIPILQQLAKQFGVTESAVKSMVESGEVGFQNLETAIVSMTSEGGQFFGMMEAQSKTLNGQLSTLADIVKELGTAFGSELLPYLKEVVEELTKLPSAWKAGASVANDSPTWQKVTGIAAARGIGTMISGLTGDVETMAEAEAIAADTKRKAEAAAKVRSQKAAESANLDERYRLARIAAGYGETPKPVAGYGAQIGAMMREWFKEARRTPQISAAVEAAVTEAAPEKLSTTSVGDLISDLARQGGGGAIDGGFSRDALRVAEDSRSILARIEANTRGGGAAAASWS